MESKSATGIVPAMIRFGSGIGAVRAVPKAKGKRPGVILLHERYGIDQHTQDLTAKLAQAGFVGFAPDLFHHFTGDLAVERASPRILNAHADIIGKLNQVPERQGGAIKTRLVC